MICEEDWVQSLFECDKNGKTVVGYYAGVVQEVLDGGKLMILFDDGESHVRKCKDVKFYYHTGMPVDRDSAGLTQWREGMRRLAGESNVSVKISGLGITDWQWNEASIRAFVLETIDIFGVSRCMFASNFPVDKLYSSFDHLYGSFRRIVSDFPEDERRKLFAENAAAIYRL